MEDTIVSGRQRKPSIMTIRVESLVQVREKVQKKTFTRWINMHLDKEHKIIDLFIDLRTGETLLILINTLSHLELKPERGHTEIHHRQNIARALNALAHVDPNHGISTSAVINGVPKLTLALVWHLILRYSHIQNMDSGVGAETHCRQWCGDTVAGYAGLDNLESDFVGTFLTGLTLSAIIHRNRNDLIDYLDLYENHSPHQRFEECFCIAEKHLDVPRLLDVEDMEKACVDEQSILTYLISLNKVLGNKPPPLQPHLAQPPPLQPQDNKPKSLDIVREDNEELSSEELTPVDITEVVDITVDMSLIEEVDITVDELDITVDQELSGILSTTPENTISPINGFTEEDKDSGLDSDTSPRNDKAGSDNDDNETVISEASTTGTATGPSLHRDLGGSNLTLDSEEYISAASSPIVSRKDYPHSEDMISPDFIEEDSLDIIYFEESLKHIATIPESVPVTVPDLQQMVDLLSSKREECLAIQRQINLQLNNNQDRETRAQLHQLLKESGHFDEILLSSRSEVINLINALGPFNEAVEHCTQFATSTEDILDGTPHTVQGAQQKLLSHRKMKALLEDEQRRLEHAHRTLSNNAPRNIPVSLHEQQRLVSEIQNHLSDIEGVLTGSVETLDFLCTRLPQLEDKLNQVDMTITAVEDEIENFETSTKQAPEQLKTKLERAKMHLNTVENLFTAIDMFSSDFDLTLLKQDWQELGDRCQLADEEVKDLIVTEEQLSEEVIQISEWAHTLEQFLGRKIKPAQSRKQLREVQAKWKEVWDDLRSKVSEIDGMMASDYSTSDLRIMSPLDVRTLQSIKDQLTSLYDPLKQRREMLQEAYSSWGVVENEMKSVGRSLTKFGAVIRTESSVRGIRPILNHIVDLSEIEGKMQIQSQQLQNLCSIISELPNGIIDSVSVSNEKLALTDQYTVLCRNVSQQRARSQSAALSLTPVVPFLRAEQRRRLKWLFNEPFLDLELSRNETSIGIMSSALKHTDLSTIPRKEYWHIIRTVAPEKVPLLVFTWVFYAVAPFGVGCSIDIPLRIADYHPDIRI